MAIENIETLTGDVAEAMKKGTISTGTISRIELGDATDFMNEEQIVARKVSPTMKFIEMEIVEVKTKTIFQKTFRYYEGAIPANSVQGQLISLYGNLTKGAELNLITKTAGRPGNEFVVWDVILIV